MTPSEVDAMVREQAYVRRAEEWMIVGASHPMLTTEYLNHLRRTGRYRDAREAAAFERSVGMHTSHRSTSISLRTALDAFSRLSDIYGFRVICGSVADCYRILGVIHQRWRAVPGRFKDYISQPKSNGYRSIHTTVSGRDGKRVEVQIRTREMHEVAEAGVAAHWSYREGVRAVNPFAVDPAKWIASLTERFDVEDHDEFLEHVKMEMYSDQVFCFTPKGDVIQLPRGATPLDYAYAIHTRIGNSCVSAKVDGIRVPLWTRLKNGQSVEIITAEGQRPQASWIDIVTTGRAKAAIRRSLREEDKGRFVKLGQELARAAFEHIGKKASDKALREYLMQQLRDGC
mgnify:CR=1 FL=1